MSVIFSRIKLNTRQVVTMIVFTLLATVAQMIAPAIVSRMVDCVSDSKETMIIVLAIVMIVLSVVACLTNIAATNLAAKLTTRFSADLQKRFFTGFRIFQHLK
ncbi:MAG: hypothetical protein K6E91_03925 [Butyrivibrio sp.]|nr:hypothetical protein [Butyrivibrio sp.]